MLTLSGLKQEELLFSPCPTIRLPLSCYYHISCLLVGNIFHVCALNDWYFQISLIKDAIPDFWRINYECFTTERNLEVLKAMDNFQAEIINFEHMLVFSVSLLNYSLCPILSAVMGFSA